MILSIYFHFDFYQILCKVEYNITRFQYSNKIRNENKNWKKIYKRCKAGDMYVYSVRQNCSYKISRSDREMALEIFEYC